MREPDAAGKRFLSDLTRNRTPIDASAVGLIVAHPDDESISCGGQLARMSGVSVVLVTDGAPRNLHDARTYGFATAADYARARAAEFRTAMQLATVQNVIRIEIPDQDAARELTPLTRALADILFARGIRVAITHAFEGGHPDHDATSFAVHAAKKLLERRRYSVAVIEVPFYHLGATEMVVQSFAHAADGLERSLALDAEAQAQKRRLLDVYITQRPTLSAFRIDLERFRPAPAYPFDSIPNAGRVLYDNYSWGLRGKEWRTLARESLDQLGLE